MEKKVCSKCKEEKELCDFSKLTSSKDGYKHECKLCVKNYYKENCRWATHKEQTRNRGGKRATRLYTFDGKTMCIADWAREVGISPQSMQKRLNKNWPLEKAFAKIQDT